MPVDKSEKRVRSMFAQIAPRYDFLNHLLSLNIDKYWRRRTVCRVPPADDAPILDLCAGTGDLALAYARRSRSRVVAADFCHEMLAIGRRKANRAGVSDRVIFVEADAQRLPFPDARFQVVAVAFGLRNVCDPECGLREMARVCRPGGKVAVLEFTTPERWPLSSIYRWYFRRILPRIGQMFTRNASKAYEYLPESVGEFPSYEALAELMRQAGLEAVSFTPLTFGIATLYLGTKPNPRREAADVDADGATAVASGQHDRRLWPPPGTQSLDFDTVRATPPAELSVP